MLLQSHDSVKQLAWRACQFLRWKGAFTVVDGLGSLGDFVKLRSTVDSNSIYFGHTSTVVAPAMRLRNAIIPFAVALISNIRNVCASALTTAVPANQRVCFYAEVDKPKEKLGVCNHSSITCYMILYKADLSAPVLLCREFSCQRMCQV